MRNQADNTILSKVSSTFLNLVGGDSVVRVFPIATLILFLVNTVLYLCFAKTDPSAFAKQYEFGALLFPYSLVHGEWYRLISSLFLHEDSGHYLSNAILFIFCIYVERALGSLQFLFCYLFSGILANILASAIIWLFHLVPFPEMVVLGSSGALFGIIGVFVSIFLKRAQDEETSIDKWLGLTFLLIAFGLLVRDSVFFPYSMWLHWAGFLAGVTVFFVINLLKKIFYNAREQLILLGIIYVPLIAIAGSAIFYETRNPSEITALQAKTAGNIYYYFDDEANASKWYLVSAEKGNAEAQAEVARRYYLGLGLGKDYTKSFFWAIKAASQNNVKAQTAVANAYCQGLGIQADYKECISWLIKAANQGDARSQWALAGKYFENSAGSLDGLKTSYYWCNKFLNNPASKLQKNQTLKLQILDIKHDIEQQLK